MKKTHNSSKFLKKLRPKSQKISKTANSSWVDLAKKCPKKPWTVWQTQMVLMGNAWKCRHTFVTLYPDVDTKAFYDKPKKSISTMKFSKRKIWQFVSLACSQVLRFGRTQYDCPWLKVLWLELKKGAPCSNSGETGQVWRFLYATKWKKSDQTWLCRGGTNTKDEWFGDRGCKSGIFRTDVSLYHTYSCSSTGPKCIGMVSNFDTSEHRQKAQ